MGGIVFAAGLRGVLVGTVSDTAPLLTMAYHDNKAAPRDLHWMSITARPYLASILATYWSRNSTEQSDDRIMAKRAGELTAVWIGTYTDLECERARAQVLQQVRAVPPVVAQIRRLFTTVSKLIPLADPMLPDGALPVNIRMMLNEMHMSAISCLFFGPQHRIAWAMWARGRWAARPDGGAESDNWAQIFAGLTDNELRHFIEAMARTEVEECRRTSLASVFVSITALAKGSNVTQQWLERRLTTLKNQAPNIDIDDLVTVEAVREYAIMYQRERIDLDRLFTIFTLAATSFTEQEYPLFTWILEQASASNVTPAMAICEVICKCVTMSIDTLIAQAPEAQWRQLITQCLHIIIDPFGSLIRPAVVSSQYADVAYLGLRMKTALLQDSSFKGFKGKPESNSVKSKAELDQIVDNFRKMQLAAINSAASLDRLFSLALNGKAVVDGDYVYVNPRGMIPAGLVSKEGDFVVPPPQVEQAAGGEGEVRLAPAQSERQVRRSVRSNWDQDYVNLPPAAYRITYQEAIHLMRDRQTEKAKALILICTQAYASGSQKPFEEIEYNKRTAPARGRAMPPAVVLAATTWEVTCPGGPDAPGRVNDAAEVEDEGYEYQPVIHETNQEGPAGVGAADGSTSRSTASVVRR